MNSARHSLISIGVREKTFKITSGVIFSHEAEVEAGDGDGKEECQASLGPVVKQEQGEHMTGNFRICLVFSLLSMCPP